MNKRTFLIYGVSKGLGKALSQNLPNQGDRVIGISRTRPQYLDQYPQLEWVAADLSQPQQAVDKVKSVVQNEVIDCIIYNVGIWEQNAFTEEYSFETSSPTEITNLITTNITSCILSIQSVIENLRLSKNAKVILIGSTWGLDNHNGREVAFSASKFALRGVVHSLRETLRADNIGVTILNLGYLASEYDNGEDREWVIKETNGELIPLQDVVSAIRFVLSTSSATCIKEIDMPAMQDENV